MNGLVKRSDVIETANKFSFTDENDRRRYLDFLDYCLKETKTAYNVDAVDKQVQEITSRIFNYCEEIDNNIPVDERTGYDMLTDIHLLRDVVRKGGVNDNR